jgi:antitoxin component YwqK of YwqJK toxin-antitoxin module
LAETPYKNGKREGVRKRWYESGAKKSLKTYKNGIENGLRKEWDENGKLTVQGNFVDRNEEIK